MCLRPPDCSQLMDRCLAEAAAQLGRTPADVTAALEHVPFHPALVALLRETAAGGVDSVIVSDANMVSGRGGVWVVAWCVRGRGVWVVAWVGRRVAAKQAHNLHVPALNPTHLQCTPTHLPTHPRAVVHRCHPGALRPLHPPTHPPTHVTHTGVH